MTIDYTALKNLAIPDVEYRYTVKDTMLYALGLGLGQDPMDPNQLRFVYEKNLRAMPSFATVMAYPGAWVRELPSGLDWRMIVAGECSVVIHREIPVEGVLIGRNRVIGITDKGRSKGAIVASEKVLTDKASGAPIATVVQNFFCRGDGGYSEAPGQHSDPLQGDNPETPAGAPDASIDIVTRPEAALIYRLGSSDMNPLHADPEAAKAVGFDRPILHGLATFGVTCRGIVAACCDHDPARLASMSARFSKPVFPGETVRVEMWRQGSRVLFRALVPQRGVEVLSRGCAELR